MTAQLIAVIGSSVALIGGLILFYLRDQHQIARYRASLPELDLSSECPVVVFACDRRTGIMLDDRFERFGHECGQVPFKREFNDRQLAIRTCEELAELNPEVEFYVKEGDDTKIIFSATNEPG
jgi:hypothetical protein